MSLDTRVVYRKLWPREHDTFKDHLLRLDTESRRMRFAGAVLDTFIETYARTAWSLDTVILGAFVDEVLRGTAELRMISDDWPLGAELAFSVETPWQDDGVGHELLRRSIGLARNRTIQTLYMICLSDNARMRHLARKHDAHLRFEPGAVSATLDPAWPSADSLVEELMEDTRGFVTAILSVGN